MATAVPFDEANDVLRAPTPEDAAAGTVYDLHIHRYRDLDGRANVLSKWQLTQEELADVVASGGAIWFSCWGGTHPPIWLTGSDPFVRSPSAGEVEAPPRGRKSEGASRRTPTPPSVRSAGCF